MAANDAVSMNVAENRQNVPMAIQENRAAVPMTVAEGGGAGGLNRKADKVTGAVAGNLAGLDANGNLTDSGKAPGDFLEAPATAGSAGQVLTADGEGGASWQDPTGGDPTEIIDDEAGSGDTDKVWSADKSHELLTEINSTLNRKITDGVYQLEFIEADGTQFFNTGVNPTSETGFEIDFLNNKTPASSSYGNLIGSRIASGNNDLEVSTYTPNSNFSGIFRAGSSTNTTARLKVGERQKITYKNGVFDVDGVSVSVTNTITTNNNPIYLLALNTNGATTYPLNARLYRAKIFSGNTTVRDFVPAYSESYGIGLYDLIGEQFYSNAAATQNEFVYQFGLTADGVNQKFSDVDTKFELLDSKLEEEDEKTRQEIKYITNNNPPFRRMAIELEMGGYDSDGDEQEDSTGVRWRTPNYIYVSDMADTTISVPSGYSMYVCEYSAGNTFVERGTWGSGTTHNVSSLYSIRYTIVKSSWTAMTEEEANCVLIKQKIPWYDYNIIENHPEYYDAQIKSVASKFINDMLSVGADGDGFVFITDAHWNGNYKHSPSLIKYLKDNTNLDLILCGGDLIDRSTSSKSSQITDMQKCVEAFKRIGIPFVTAMGNHERNSAGVSDSNLYISANEAFSITQNPVNWMPLHYADLTGKVCFYLDRPATKTRVIFIDSGYNNIGDGIDITADEIAWAEDTIESIETGWHIIIVVHSLGDYQYLNDPISESNPFIYSSGANDLFTALDTLSATYNIEAIFAGHSHVDNNAETTGGIPIVWVNSDAKWQYHGMTQPSDGTIDAQCFDVVTMDYSEKKIYLRRVGRGSDRIISYGE